MELITVIGSDVLDEISHICRRTPPGDFVEVGVYRGGSGAILADIAYLQGREIFLYDTFTGIPYQDGADTHKVGDFSDTSFESVARALPSAWVIPGIFPGTAHPCMQRIAFAHIDCDQYRSVKESAQYLEKLMVPGGIMWFDDYCLEGAKNAIDEMYLGRLQKSKCGKVYVIF